DLPARPHDPAAVHRADRHAVVEQPEEHEVLEDVGARQDAVDARVVEGERQAIEEAAPVGHGHRVDADGQRAAGRTGRGHASQPDRSPWQSAPPKASPAPRPHTTETGTGGTTLRRSGVATRTPSPPSFTMAISTPRPRSRSAAASGSAVPTATSHSVRLPTA